LEVIRGKCLRHPEGRKVAGKEGCVVAQPEKKGVRVVIHGLKEAYQTQDVSPLFYGKDVWTWGKDGIASGESE